ncbi:MAG TPA: hypothetical protein VMG58_01720 [Candidatus Sulfotelmatobacter sp.]|nr:hypothetical protein [Candidatus Sulfotelmatobacter sp.]
MSTRGRQWIALMLSGIFPGLGQLYLRRWGKGAAFLVAGGVLSWLLGVSVPLEDLLAGQLSSPLAALGVTLALLCVYLWSVWDAWRTGGESKG